MKHTYTPATDLAVQETLSWFRSQKNFEEKFRHSLRTAVNEVLDGRRTGRYSIEQLTKNEKSYIGTKVEIILQDTFEIPRGVKKEGAKEKPLDYLVRGHEVDCKFTIGTNWAIPQEAVGRICLLVSVDEARERFSAGVLRSRPEFLTGKPNNDGKRGVSAKVGKKQIEWITKESAFPKSILLSLNPESQKYICDESRSGQERVNRLFERVQHQLIDRDTTDTVAQQLDGMARVREGDGRARTVLRNEGILIAGHWKAHRKILETLHVQIPRAPRNGELVSFRVVEAKPWHQDLPRTALDGREWVLAKDGDPRENGPRLPGTKE
ncbi:NaeI family type II restriction endonuclease [Streptomyces alboflavus]|uniref:NaeI family type II restriction endonuclease n=1 Tax=Streptomyces alboflavus TaxID=67267 RepID=UPI000997A36B|nr:NaeI family type II restriction endonuclease [Streptomyces alboflavus]